MGAKGYRTQKAAAAEARTKVREGAGDGRDSARTIHRCARHKKRQATGWSKWGAAAGVHLCDACFDYLTQKYLRDPEFVEALNGAGTAERTLAAALEGISTTEVQ